MAREFGFATLQKMLVFCSMQSLLWNVLEILSGWKCQWQSLQCCVYSKSYLSYFQLADSACLAIHFVLLGQYSKTSVVHWKGIYIWSNLLPLILKGCGLFLERLPFLLNGGFLLSENFKRFFFSAANSSGTSHLYRLLPVKSRCRSLLNSCPLRSGKPTWWLDGSKQNILLLLLSCTTSDAYWTEFANKAKAGALIS